MPQMALESVIDSSAMVALIANMVPLNTQFNDAATSYHLLFRDNVQVRQFQGIVNSVWEEDTSTTSLKQQSCFKAYFRQFLHYQVFILNSPVDFVTVRKLCLHS